MKETKNFLVKDMKFYSERDYFSKDFIRYHTIFNYPLTKTLYVEINLINKKFGKVDWNDEFYIQFYSLNNELNLFENNIATIKKSISIFGDREYEVIKLVTEFIMKDIAPTEKNCIEYIVECENKSDKLISENIHIQYDNRVTDQTNPYFKINKFYVYGDSYEEPQTAFDITSEEQDINVKMEILPIGKNLLNNKMLFELLFVLKNKVHLSIGEYLHKFVFFSNDIHHIDFSLTDLFGNLPAGKYDLSVLFFGYERKETEFLLGDWAQIWSPGDSAEIKIINMVIDEMEDDLDELKPLRNLIGLKNVKKEIKKVKNLVEYKKAMKKFVKEDLKKIKLHTLFVGNPGTGKTRLAMMLGKIYKELGLLSDGKVTVACRDTLIGGYIGETAIKTAKVIEAARGGILFLDEAYALFNPASEKDYGKEAIETISKAMSDSSEDLIIIAAGYKKEMETFLTANKGFASRFMFTYHFDDFTPEELLEIAKQKAHEKELVISAEALKYLAAKLKIIYKNREENFGNARFISSLIRKAEMNMSQRIMPQDTDDNLNKYENEGDEFEDFDFPEGYEEKSLVAEKKVKIIPKLTEEDFQKVLEEKTDTPKIIQFNEEDYKIAIEELNKMTGLTNVKNDINELASILKYHTEEEFEGKRKYSLHSVFKGNPGTGKTTVARILGKIYKSIGLLPSGHVVECDRASLVAEYIGQTAVKTDMAIMKAIGGILFIDEAYSLSRSDNGRDFGHEAIEVLLKRMEDHRGKFVVVCAGYSEEMDYFLLSNPGLKSRFDKIFEFNDYTKEELSAIFYNQLAEKEFIFPVETHLKANSIIEKISRNRNKNFSNARMIRSLTEMIIWKHDFRLSQVPKNIRSERMKIVITPEDLDVDFNKLSIESKKTIGF